MNFRKCIVRQNCEIRKQIPSGLFSVTFLSGVGVEIRSPTYLTEDSCPVTSSVIVVVTSVTVFIL
jgi:hypothetical protein